MTRSAAQWKRRGAFVGDGNCYLSAVLQARVIDPALGTDRDIKESLSWVKITSLGKSLLNANFLNMRPDL